MDRKIRDCESTKKKAEEYLAKIKEQKEGMIETVCEEFKLSRAQMEEEVTALKKARALTAYVEFLERVSEREAKSTELITTAEEEINKIKPTQEKMQEELVKYHEMIKQKKNKRRAE